MDYIEVRLTHVDQDVKDVLIALLSEIQFEGFEENDDELKAYVPSSAFNDQALKTVIAPFQIESSYTELPSTNWNSVWESNFEPVTVEDFCCIRADFHAPSANVQHDIIITPKMSFGTGHHATTHMMIQQMQHISFKGKSVMDFGTGTGVLAILAEKLGAANIEAIDNDEWSITNAQENFLRNRTDKINLSLADNAETYGTFNIILANITRNVIMDNFEIFMNHLATDGILLLSGILEEDEHHIQAKASENALKLKQRLQNDKWICMKFEK